MDSPFNNTQDEQDLSDDMFEFIDYTQCQRYGPIRDPSIQGVKHFNAHVIVSDEDSDSDVSSTSHTTLSTPEKEEYTPLAPLRGSKHVSRLPGMPLAHLGSLRRKLFDE